MNPKGKIFPWQVFGLEESAEVPRRKCDGCSFKVFTTLNVHSGLWFTLYDNQRCQRRRGFGETVKTTTKMKKTVTTAFNPVKNSHWKVLFSRAMQKTIYFILYTHLYSIIQCMAEQKRFSNQKKIKGQALQSNTWTRLENLSNLCSLLRQLNYCLCRIYMFYCV